MTGDKIVSVGATDPRWKGREMTKIRMTEARVVALEHVAEMDHAGGYCARDRREHARLNDLRRAGLLKRYGGRKFFVTTDAGLKALRDHAARKLR